MFISKQKLYTLLTDPFYYGKLIWGNEIGTVHPSVPRLLTEDEFWKIQALLGRRGHARPSVHTELPYRGLLKCGCCQSTYIPYARTKTLVNGTQVSYEYAKCNRDGIKRKCTQKQISLKDIDKQITELLDQIAVSEDFCDWAIDWIKREHKGEADAQLAVLKSLEAALENIQVRRNRLVEMYMDELLDDQKEYKERKIKLAEEEKKILKDINALKARTLNWMDLAIKAFNFAKNARYNFEHGTYEEKTLILRTLGSNFYILNGKLCVDLIKPFLIFKNNQLTVQSSFETIEPPEFAMVGANTGDFEHWFVKWSG